ncbi:HNH endonuclease [Pantoea dispersa]|uniref:HNH endonuclease n=1 Tax=Pantoea dispersa TaxID=59814 RepID=UPI00123B776E|nr:HNH endonuclease [Pantoea dispersa]KAA8673434.1 hypothetical protein F4W08_00170 [Pantoea dispersa]
MFYPKLSRQDKYDLKDEEDEESFYHYSHYRQIIETDCLNRCVYCDVLLNEHAFEGMHLDHFRPQKHFSQLSSNPRNLVLTCPKCNRLKSCHWPCEKELNKPSHNGKDGFVDPFIEELNTYVKIEIDGEITPLRGPAPYFIALLRLNRLSRIQVRRRRILTMQKAELNAKISKISDDLIDGLISGEVSKEDALKIRDALSVIKEEYAKIALP